VVGVEREQLRAEEQLRELARNSFEASFLEAKKKLDFLNMFDAAAAAR